MKNLECDLAIVLSVFCEINGSHASASELTVDFILVREGFFEAVEQASAPFQRGTANLPNSA